jgi:hypothetical protein
MLTLLSLLIACGDKSDDTATTSVTADAVACENNICILSGTITEDLTLEAKNQYLLRGGVFIGDDVNETILTIEAGTTIYGESSTDGMLVIRRNSKIYAEGRADAPIVFTSSKEAGTRGRGDWGGLIINGNAPINACADDEAELCEAFGEGGTGFYGGTDTADNSGILKYVRVEFAGTLISPENELNGIAFQGVGSETEVDFIQVHMNADDGVEFFGGNVFAKHILVTGVGDDSLDWTDGWQGGAQFVILHQNDDSGDNGIEADNNGENNEAEPRSNPLLSNFTIIGSPDSEKSDKGVLLREGTAAALANFLVVGFNDVCLSIDNSATVAQADAGNVTMTNSVLNCETNFDDVDGLDLEAWFTGQDGNAIGGAELTDAYTLTAPNYVPTSTGDATALDASTLGEDFDATDFIGAVGAEDWTAGWTTHELN